MRTRLYILSAIHVTTLFGMEDLNQTYSFKGSTDSSNFLTMTNYQRTLYQKQNALVITKKIIENRRSCQDLFTTKDS